MQNISVFQIVINSNLKNEIEKINLFKYLNHFYVIKVKTYIFYHIYKLK